METPERTKRRRIQKEVNKVLVKIWNPVASLPCRVTSVASRILNVRTSQQELGSLQGLNVENVSEINQIESVSDPQNSLERDSNGLEIDFPQSKCTVIADWALRNNISHVALNELLKTVRVWLPLEGFPSDSRTLLRTPRTIETFRICGGEFFHFGLRDGITESIRRGLKEFATPPHYNLSNHQNLITLKLGIDGLPISRSSNL
jgi:hypothetical protein